ncbi:two-component regulator propeller domain-containing protein [Flavobacteriaceae bacterium SZ-1-7]|uniref:hybrid sensor histidine kinase/response regulator transcription factor n=1 Tax=Tamlana sedimenti TaxID=3134126 RepID=UPI003122AC02
MMINMRNGWCLLFFSISLFLNAQNLQIEKLNVTNGLPDNSIRKIIQDDKGYLWFGTLNGLSKYDGNNFKNYYAIPGDTTSLSNSRIESMFEDKKGFVWCWSDNYNLQRINPITNKVTDIKRTLFDNKIDIIYFRPVSNGDIWVWGNFGYAKIEYTDGTNLKATLFNNHNEIHFLYEGFDRDIWIGTEKGLVKIDTNDKVAINYKDKSFISFNKFENKLWFGTDSGEIAQYSKNNNKFTLTPLESIDEKFTGSPIYAINQVNVNRVLFLTENRLLDLDINKNSISNVYNSGFKSFDRFLNDSYNNTWIVFKQTRGIYRYSIEHKEIQYYSLNSKERNFLGDPDKHQILEDSNKDIWVGIHGGGLFLYNRNDNEFINYRADEEKIESISSDIVLSLFEDSSKNLWVGTMYGGLNKINLTKEDFIWHHPLNTTTNPYENEIRTVAETQSGNLWLGSKGGKIFFYENNLLKHTFPDDLKGKNKEILSDLNVYSLFIDHDENLWIGTKGKGLFVIKNINNTNIDALEVMPYKIGSLQKIYAITQDSYNNYWIGSHGNGLGVIKNPFKNPKHLIYNTELVSNYIRYLFTDSDNNLWIATNEGINLLTSDQLNAENRSFIPIKHIKENKSSLSFNAVDHIFQASNNTFFVSTMGGGVNILDYPNFKNRNFEWQKLDVSNGLSSNKVFSVQEDRDNNIWICNSLGVDKYYADTGRIDNFLNEKNLSTSYFSEGCSATLKNGNLLFGNHKGFITFNPRQIEKDTTAYPIVLSKLIVNGNEQIPNKSGLIKHNIEYEEGIKLAYNQNNIEFNFSVLDFKNPNKNKYSYKLENYDDNWSTPLANNKAIYQNLPHGDYTFLLKATNSDGVMLSETKEFNVTITPPFFKSTVGYLTEAILLGIMFFGFLYLYKRQLSAKQEIAFSNRLNDKKLEYYTNISHEFKTPLTLISCHLQDILNNDNISTEEIKSLNGEIQKNSSYLLNLVEQILDFRKIREDKMKLLLINTDLNDFIKDIHSQFLPLANKNGVNLNLDIPDKSIYGDVDIRVLKKIVYNLMSNAIKFTPSGKTVQIILKPIDDNKRIELKIKDEGVGIAKKDQKQLFERFHKSANSSGLGLAYVKELVDTHKGLITLESELNTGTCFTIELPITKAHFSENEIELDDYTSIDSLTEAQPNDPEEAYEATEKEAGIADSILIIEDSNDMRLYLEKKFKYFSKVFTAKNGKEGVELAIKEIPGIIICDLMMPVMDGIEVVETLRDNFNTCHIPIILLTANSSQQKKLEGIKTGADDYINKPFDINHLKVKVDALIAQRKKIIDSFSKNPELSIEILTDDEENKNFVKSLKKVIEDSMGEANFSIDSTAAKLGLSRSLFYTKMKEVTGGTPNEFIKTVQLKKAARLLEETNYPIPEISLICGFNDHRYFAKIFKSYFNKTPKQYQLDRKKNKVKKEYQQN